MKLIKNVKWYVIVTGFVLFSILSVGSYAYLNDTKTTSKMQLSLKLSANQSVRLVQDKSLLAQTRVDYSKITPLHFNESKTENEIYFYNFTSRTGQFAYNTEIGNILDNTSQAGSYANNIAKQLKGKINISLSSEKVNILPSWLDQENENKIKLTITTSGDFPEAYYNKPLRIGFDIELHDKSGKAVQFNDGSTFIKDQWIVVQIDKPTESNYPSDEVYEVKQALSYMYNDGKFYTITPGVVFNKDTSTLTQEQIEILRQKYLKQTEPKFVYSDNNFNIRVDKVEYIARQGFKITYSLSDSQNTTTLAKAKSIQEYPTGYLHLGWIDPSRVYKGYQDVIRPIFLSSDLNFVHANYTLLTDKTILTRSQSVDIQLLTKTTSAAQDPQLFSADNLASKFSAKIIGNDSSAFNIPSIVQNDKGTAIRISQKLGVSAGKRALLQIIEQETNKVVLQRELQTTSEFTPNIDAKKYNISQVVTANKDTPYDLFRYAPNSMTVKFDSNKKAYVGNSTFYFKLENHSIFTNMLPTYRFVLSTPKHMKVLSEEYSADSKWLQVNLEYTSNEDINTIKSKPIDFNYRILGQISDNNSSSDLQTDSYFSYNNSIFK
ncbi:hypothetical protein CIRMBP1230_01185 [Enterococcus cecorum]|uniref:hypothetical protein n=3 Tax=Enterococcus cecorum TaxID=44008 RepID=UPI0022D10E6D|nr:hypothetical protein [Enterococcus cecorum]CAI3295750.1 hypothetical protein CIRMBP1206_00505 [Enterococcus cecorum]CAI3299372.1 hypothetical protein CIRMBP1251_00530 [Enterococcus cecorum]CAI3309387.1 hypothetical protein CIRMBP1228_00756 [Enterococcus cecorum]CAI3314264.1 hypothetical protein CIRMBP1208_00657 [Enterococcus cecorum]CAI3315076.1 hypothetical protein CIRMBP1239_00654 [Enterococcus cecorum]